MKNTENKETENHHFFIKYLSLAAYFEWFIYLKSFLLTYTSVNSYFRKCFYGKLPWQQFI